ncbi:MAG: RNA ligase family protein [Lachnospiraceae bacterium]|nr:RNA ligase family protein [Lachnospiraceae bacterium]
MFYKFPSTPYIETDMSIKRKDKVLSKNEVENILAGPITIEEKIDGANLGISFGSNGELRLQNRGNYLLTPLEGQWKRLDSWIDCHETAIFDVIMDKYILFGEWCYAKHSIYYNALPDWFIGFDIYDTEREKFLSVKNRDILLDRMGVKVVPRLGNGIFNIDELFRFFERSRYGDEKCEGIYIRQDQGRYLKYRAKLVRREFRQNIKEHWSKSGMQCNCVFWE